MKRHFNLNNFNFNIKCPIDIYVYILTLSRRITWLKSYDLKNHWRKLFFGYTPQQRIPATIARWRSLEQNIPQHSLLLLRVLVSLRLQYSDVDLYLYPEWSLFWKHIKQKLKDLCQVSLLMLNEFKRMNFYSTYNHHKTTFLMISGWIGINLFYKIRVIFEVKMISFTARVI